MLETGWTEKADKEGFPAVFPEGTLPDLFKPGGFSINSPMGTDSCSRWHSGGRNIPDVTVVNSSRGRETGSGKMGERVTAQRGPAGFLWAVHSEVCITLLIPSGDFAANIV
jgi:hypothetical protein